MNKHCCHLHACIYYNYYQSKLIWRSILGCYRRRRSWSLSSRFARWSFFVYFQVLLSCWSLQIIHELQVRHYLGTSTFERVADGQRPLQGGSRINVPWVG